MIAGGAVLIAVLIFAAGYLLGARHDSVAGGLLPVAAPPFVKPAVAAPPPPSPVTRERPTPAALRFGVYATPEEAKAAVDQLAGQEVAAKLVELPTSSGAMLYVVRSAPYPSRDVAVAAAAELEKKLGRAVAVIPAD